MSLDLHRPASAADLAECMATTTLQVWALARVQVRLGPSWALRTADGQAVACGGYLAHPTPGPDGGRLCEGWFMAAPEARRHMLAVVRAIRLTPIPPAYCRAIVFVSTPEGRRIAGLAGFRHIGTRSDGMEVWQS